MDVHPTKSVSIGIDPYPDVSIELDRIGLKTYLPSGYDIHS